MIANIEVYNARMSEGMEDKLFFLNKVSGIDTIIDFGCANGELFKFMPKEWKKIGIDNNPQMREAAKANFSSATYVSSFEEVRPEGVTLLNLSSVIHEVYSYLPKEEVDAFWNNVFNSGYDYITIRDMMVSNETNRTWNGCGALLAHRHPLFEDFRKFYPLSRERDLIHFFLKYRYEENWERERAENYFPITIEELLALIPDTYEIVYLNHFALKWTRDKVAEDFGYEIKDNTHVKLILRKKK